MQHFQKYSAIPRLCIMIKTHKSAIRSNILVEKIQGTMKSYVASQKQTVYHWFFSDCVMNCSEKGFIDCAILITAWDEY